MVLIENSRSALSANLAEAAAALGSVRRLAFELSQAEEADTPDSALSDAAAAGVEAPTVATARPLPDDESLGG